MSKTTLQKFLDVLNDSAPDTSDSRMQLFLMKSPLQLISIISLYLMMVFKIGPHLMKNRKPFSLKTTIIGYNIIQIIYNLVLFFSALSVVRKLNFMCAPPETSNSDFNIRQIQLHYAYILLKYFDLIETVFYVLRKKDRQISFLHVYHHIGILLAAWISGKYFPGGQAIYVGFYNSLIHCIMYCYYLASSWNSKYSGNVWWKKYVTSLQICQHCLIFLSILPAVLNPTCTYPKGLMSLFAINVLLIIYLFGKFYRNAYLRKGKAT